MARSTSPNLAVPDAPVDRCTGYRAAPAAFNLLLSLRPAPVDQEPAGLRRADLRRAPVRSPAVLDGGRGVRDLLRAVRRRLSVNDVTDRETDRQHPLKSRRPIAAGRCRRRSRGAAHAAAGRVAALGRRSHSAASRSARRRRLPRAAGPLLGPLKHIVIIDVLTIAIGFVLRAVAGAVAIDVVISHWLFVCTILLALFIALAKRRHELVLLADGATSHRPILGEYSPYLLDQMIAVVTASTLIAYIFYTISPETAAEVRHRLARPDDSVSAVRHLPLPLSRAPARGRRKPGRPAAERPAAARLRRAVASWCDRSAVMLIIYAQPLATADSCLISTSAPTRSTSSRSWSRSARASARSAASTTPSSRSASWRRSSSRSSSIRAACGPICSSSSSGRSPRTQPPELPNYRVRGRDALRVAPRRRSAGSAGCCSRS